MATLNINTARSDISTDYVTIYTCPANTSASIQSIYFSNKSDVDLQFDLVITVNDLDFFLSRHSTLPSQCTIIIDKIVNMKTRDQIKVKTLSGFIDVFASITETR